MLFRQLLDPGTWTYTYLIADAHTREAVLVDPVLEQVERDLTLIHELGLTLRYCLATHIHADSMTGTGKLRELTECQGIIPGNGQPPYADRSIQDGEVLWVGDVKLEAIATPGHTDSHMTFLVNGTHLLTGDGLLIRGCGRTDLAEGNPEQMYKAVTERLFTLPEETLVYPGHDYHGHLMSTIGEEKHWNLWFVESDRDRFIALMRPLNMPTPPNTMEAVPAHQACGHVSKSSLV